MDSDPYDFDPMSLSDGSWLREGAAWAGRARRLGLGLLVIGLVALGGVATRFGDQAGSGGEAVSAATDAAAERAEAVAEDAIDRVAGAVEAGADAAVTDASPAAAEPAAPEPVVWAAPTERSPVTPVPAHERVPRPEAVRGIYVGAWTVGSARLEELIRLANETDINAFVIDIKDVTGEISYATQLPLARQIDADRRIRIGDIRRVLDRLKEHGIYPIARIVAFKDPLLADARPEWAIQTEDGEVWEDNKGVRWVDSFNRNVWDYNISLAREAISLGFAEVQWDYVRFPDVPSSYMVEAIYPARDGRAMTDAIREFIAYSDEQLADLDVEITADVFGITTSTNRDIGIGQVWEKLSDVTDVLLPMVYPSHYPDGSFGYDNPNGAPYQIVRKAMEDGVERSKLIDNAAVIRPWLQAFSMGEPEYGPMHIRAQIDAVYDAGLTEWVLWNPSVRYPREAFTSADGVDPWFAGTGADLYLPAPKVEVKGALGKPAGSGG